MKLKELRKEAKKTQIEVANYLHISQSNYGKYELEEIEPNIQTLIKLADYYNVTIDYLVGRNYTNDVGYLTDNQRILLNDFNKLKEINQFKILAEIKGMLLVQD